MTAPDVSIVILVHDYPQYISKCLETLRTLTPQTPVSYEVVVVDNNSSSGVVELLRRFKAMGAIDTLVESPVNHFFSEGNNIGFRNSHPESKYILLLNSDVGFLRGDWLEKLVQWMEGVPPTLRPSVWDEHPTVPTPGPRDIVTYGWSYDENIDSKARPEGWCYMVRRKFWTDLSQDLPFYYGFEEAVAKSIRKGAKAGVLSQYGTYLVHREQGSRTVNIKHLIHNKREPDMKAWFDGLHVESLDFSIGPFEHDSYLSF